jgi:hypothetical protein
MRPDHPLLVAKGRLIVHLLFCPNRSRSFAVSEE